MNRINQLFERKKKGICSIFVTAGYPTLDATVNQVLELAQNGADLIELGMPFSDPLADGPTIQQSSMVALNNGMHLDVLFNQVQQIREKSEVPIVLMGYINPILNYGIENFLHACEKADIDGLILPDISLEEYEREFKHKCSVFKIPLIFLVTPATSEDRLKRIVSHTTAFVYFVSSSSTTGASGQFSQEQVAAFERYRKHFPDIPTLMGFGIHDAKTFELACKYFNGGIIGSAYIRAIESAISPASFLSDLMDLQTV